MRSILSASKTISFHEIVTKCSGSYRLPSVVLPVALPLLLEFLQVVAVASQPLQALLLLAVGLLL